MNYRRVNLDIVMYALVLIAGAVLFVLVTRHEISVGALLPWWRLPLAVASFLGLRLAIEALSRRYALSYRARYFLSTVPFAALFTPAMNHSGEGTPASFAISLVVVEAILLALFWISWLFDPKRKNQAT